MILKKKRVTILGIDWKGGRGGGEGFQMYIVLFCIYDILNVFSLSIYREPIT